MPMIKIEGSEPREFEKLPEGFYEVYVDAVDEPQPQGDLEKSTIRLRVRDDVDGDYQRRMVFVNINTNPNIAWKLSNIATAAGVAKGTEFIDLQEYLDAIKGASMKIKLGHREWNGKIYEDVKSFYPTSLDPYVIENAEDEIDLI